MQSTGRKSEKINEKRRQELRRKKRARRRRKRILKVTGILLVILLGIIGYQEGSKLTQNPEELVSDIQEVMNVFGGSSSDVYSEELQEALEKNPELEEFARDYEKAMESGAREDTSDCELTDEELKAEHPLFLQWDKRWGYRAYGNSVVGLSGCGPTCMSMAVYYLTGNESITPDKTARYANQMGYYVEGSGTAWSFMTEGAANYGLQAEELSLDEHVMKKRLDNKAVLICAMDREILQAADILLLFMAMMRKDFLSVIQTV